MMSEELKTVLKKPEAERTDEDKKLIKEAIEVFQKETKELSEKHSLVHKAVLKVTAEGILPTFEIIVYEAPAAN